MSEHRTTGWSPDALRQIGEAQELEIATRRADGTLRRWIPIWVVTVDGGVYVRTWRRRDSGWFGHVTTELPRARIRVPGLEADVTVADVGAERRAGIDAAYRAKYGQQGDAPIAAMITDDAVAATLRLDPE